MHPLSGEWTLGSDELMCIMSKQGLFLTAACRAVFRVAFDRGKPDINPSE